MRNIFTLLLTSASLVSLASAVPFPPAPPGTVFCDTLDDAPLADRPIIAVSPSDFVGGLELAVTSTTATLAKEGHRSGWNIDNGGIGAFDYCHYWYLNTGVSIGSYLPLYWDFDNQITTTWNVTFGEPIQWQSSRTSKPINTFIACKGTYKNSPWKLYLQLGTDTPSGATCFETQLWLPYIR